MKNSRGNDKDEERKRRDEEKKGKERGVGGKMTRIDRRRGEKGTRKR